MKSSLCSKLLISFVTEGTRKVNRKVQGMPQSQTAANPRHQQEENKDKNIHAQNKQTNVREAQTPAPSSPSEDKEHEKTIKHKAPCGINHKATQN